MKYRFKWLFLGVLFFWTALVWGAIWANLHSNDLTVYFLDVGQGDAIFIDTPNGNQMLIDGGRNKQVIVELSKIMSVYDRSIDVVLATHPDSDHIGGLSFVLERYQVRGFIDSHKSSDTATSRALKSALDGSGAKKVIAKRGMRVVLDRGIYFDILYPNQSVENLEANEASIIGRLVYGQNTFIFTGDAPAKIENYLVFLDKEKLQADVLKIGHHGSRTSSSEIFVRTVAPTIAVVSAGQDNQYGHPHQEVVDRFRSLNIEVLSTADLGTIKITSDGRRIKTISR